MANQDEITQVLTDLAVGLSDVSSQLDKATAEIIAALANQSNVSPALQAAVDALTPIKDSLKSKSQTLDDLNADV